jgi:hypothetical protein
MLDEDLHRVGVAERRLQQMYQLGPEMHDVNALREDQAEIEWQLQPAAGEDQPR